MLVRAVQWAKQQTGLRTWQIESAIVFSILVSVAILTGGAWKEWVGTFAVWLTFMHAQVSDRLAEKEGQRAAAGDLGVECYRWERRYFLAKEIIWLVLFASLGSYSALVGVIVFLGYRYWRRAWRNPT